MPTSLPPILVFDSGIGGLSVWEGIRALLPHLPCVYCADNRIFPYGLQEESVLVERVCSLIPLLVKLHHPALIVVACNSASTVVLDALREVVAVPVVGVVPAIKPAAEQSRSGVIGLLATPGTVKRQYTDRLIEQFAGECKVIRVGSNVLVEQAERKLRGEAVDIGLLAEAIAPFMLADTVPDIVVLGCTHFPFLSEELSFLLPGIALLDSADAIARRTAHLLNRPGTPVDAPTSAETTEHLFLFTADTPDARRLLPALGTRGFSEPRFLDV
jgi:glutamate racemase